MSDAARFCPEDGSPADLTKELISLTRQDHLGRTRKGATVLGALAASWLSHASVSLL